MPTFYALQPDYITALNGLVDGTGIHAFMRIGAGAPAMPAGVQLFVYGGASAAVARLNGPRAWDLISNTDSLLHVVDATGGAIIAKFGFGGVGFAPGLETLATHATTTLWNQHPGVVLTNADNTVNNSAWLGWKDSTGAYQAGIAAQWSSHSGSGGADLVFGTRVAGGNLTEKLRISGGGSVVLPNMAGFGWRNSAGTALTIIQLWSDNHVYFDIPSNCYWRTGGSAFVMFNSGWHLLQAAPIASAGVVALGNGTATTVGAAGGASALPATPVKYWILNESGTNYKVPLYNA
jgi:hypothetical protein